MNKNTFKKTAGRKPDGQIRERLNMLPLSSAVLELRTRAKQQNKTMVQVFNETFQP